LRPRDMTVVSRFAEHHELRILYAPPWLSEEPHQLDVILGSDEEARRRLLADSVSHFGPIYDEAPFPLDLGKWPSLSADPRAATMPASGFAGRLVLALIAAQALIVMLALVFLPVPRAVHGDPAGFDLLLTLGFLVSGAGFGLAGTSFLECSELLLGRGNAPLASSGAALLLGCGLGRSLAYRFAERRER